MRLYSEADLDILRRYWVDETIESISLHSYGFGIQIAATEVHCNERVYGIIGSQKYLWKEAPSVAPWGALVRQKIHAIGLSSPSLLRVELESGDSLEIETIEHQYESVVITLERKNSEVVMEIF